MGWAVRSAFIFFGVEDESGHAALTEVLHTSPGGAMDEAPLSVDASIDNAWSFFAPDLRSLLGPMEDMQQMVI